MGKKGKVEKKRKREAYFAGRRKQKKQDRRERLKNRKPLSQDLQNIKDGITDMITEQGIEPTSVAYFGCLMSLLQGRPDPTRLPYLFSLTDYFMADLSLGVLQKYCYNLMDITVALMKTYLADSLVTKKGFALLKSLFFHLTPNQTMFNKLQAMEPNKLHNDHMPLYLRTLTMAMVNCDEKNKDLIKHLLFGYVESNTQNLFETAEPVANASAKSFQVVFDACLNLDVVGNQAELVTKILEHFIMCISDIQFRNNWDHVAECIAAVLSKVALTRSVINVRELYGSLITMKILPVVDKLRSLDDFHFNSACDKVLGACLRCIGVETFLSVVPMNPLNMDPIQGRHYLLNVMRRNVGHDNLAYFTNHFAPLITQCRKAEEDALLMGKHLERKTLASIHYQLWDLLPGFATFPKDLTAGNSFKTIAKELTKMLNDVELSRIACKTFVVLIEKSKYLVQWEPEEDSDDEEEEEDEEDVRSDEGQDEDAEDNKMEESTAKPTKEGEPDFASLDPIEQVEARMKDTLGTDFTNVPAETDPLTYHMINKERAEEYLRFIGSFSKNIVPLICNAIEKELSENRRVLLLQALRSYASVADRAVVNGVFKQVSKTLLQSRSEGTLNAEQIKKNRTMMEIGCVIVEALDTDALMILLEIVRPLLVDESDDYLLQKKSYRVLSRICRTRGDVIGDSIDTIISMLALSRDACDAASRRERILCFMHTATLHIAYDRHDAVREFVSATLPEVMFALKDSSGRSRDASFECLAAYSEMIGVNSFVQLVLAGLTMGNPQSKACAIITLSKLLHEYHDIMDAHLSEAIIQSGIMLISHASNEIKNAAMSFTRILLKVVTKNEEVKRIVDKNLQRLISGCLVWTSQKTTPGNTRRNVQMILERCIKRFGYDYMHSVFPKEHTKYIEYVETMRQREIKKGLKAKERRRGKESEKRADKFNQVFYNEKREVMKMPADCELDLMDEGMVKHFVSSKQHNVIEQMRRDDTGKRDGMNVAMRDGKIMIQTEADHKRDMRHELLQRKMSQMDGTQRTGLEDVSGGLLQRKKRGRDDDDDGIDLKDLSKAYDPSALRAKRELDELNKALKGPTRGRVSKRQRVEADVRTGSQFRAKTGSYGDVKKGAVDPYAYVPLNAKYLNKRHRMKSISRMGAVDETAKKGKNRDK